VRKVGMPPPVGNTTAEIVSLVVAPVAAIIQAVAVMVGPYTCAPPTAEALANGSLPQRMCHWAGSRIHSDTTPPGSSLISNAWRPGLRTTRRPANEKTLGSKPKS
jgi:hypothetical protein